jgi:hypothetical protein
MLHSGQLCVNLLTCWVLDEEKAKVVRYRAHIAELIYSLAMIALSCNSPQEAHAIGLNPSWWRFRVFNALKESRERLCRLHTNPSFVAIHLQFLFGQSCI